MTQLSTARSINLLNEGMDLGPAATLQRLQGQRFEPIDTAAVDDALDLQQHRRVNAEFPESQAQKQADIARITGHLAAHSHRLISLFTGFNDPTDQS